MTKAKTISIHIPASLTYEMTASEWKARLAEMANEEDPEAAALGTLEQEFEGVDVDCWGSGRAWVTSPDGAVVI